MTYTVTSFTHATYDQRLKSDRISLPKPLSNKVLVKLTFLGLQIERNPKTSEKNNGRWKKAINRKSKERKVW